MSTPCNHHVGDGVIGPSKTGIQRGHIVMRQGADLMVEWRDRSIDWFIGEDVLKLARQDAPEGSPAQ